MERIQNNNIWKALELIDRTKDYPEDSRFVWNVESLWAVENFLGIASEQDKQRFIAAVKAGSIALSANYANILTGLCTPEEMHWIVEYADSLQTWYGGRSPERFGEGALPITMAMQTDIPGMSWSMVDAYAAHGIRHLSQGPNYIPDMPDGGDRIGSTLREQGDKPYWWKGTTGKDSILVWTAGQGYGGWHGYTAGSIKERGTDRAAAMPLTTITAWEALFDRLGLSLGRPADAGTLLITAGAGGVGSIAIQLARRLTGARIVATASRPESRAQAEGLGAHLVLDHARPLSQGLEEAGIRWAERIFSVSHTHLHFPELARIVAPQGRICVIDDPDPIDVRLLKARCASLHWEAMFARSGFETPDMAEQGRLLDQVAALVDEGLVRSTHARTLGRIDAANLRAAHAMIESGRTIGKLVLAGF